MTVDHLFEDGQKTPAEWKAAFEAWLARGPASPDEAMRIFELLGKTAEKGDANAAFFYAKVIHEGLGVPASPREALTWYIQAALNEHTEAQFRAGLLYETGAGSASEPAKQFYGFMPSDGNDTTAQLTNLILGVVNTHTDPHLELAAYWYKRAGVRGHAWAMAAYARLISAGVTPCVDRFGKMPD